MGVKLRLGLGIQLVRFVGSWGLGVRSGSGRAHRTAKSAADGAYGPPERRAARAKGLEHGNVQAAAARA